MRDGFDGFLQDDMDDWWAYQQQLESEMRQLELEGLEGPKMKVQPAQERDITGTFFQGYMWASYYELVKAFGEPLEGDGYKTRAEWVLTFTVPTDEPDAPEEIIATIYDWKKYDEAVRDVREWNIGGRGIGAVDAVVDYLNYVRDMERMSA